MKQKKLTGSMAGKLVVPDDFDTMARDEIERLFSGEDQVKEKK
ncbi:hypothetical protein [Sulfurirhabdus autotrophica]|nr:hypothetical protein [Sulfurirhabdus autotrophica]